MLEILEHFDTLHRYFWETIVHWLVCGVSAALTVHSHYRGVEVLRHLGTVVVFFWIAYQITEFARIQDDVDIDIANGLIAYIAGALLAWAVHENWRKDSWITVKSSKD